MLQSMIAEENKQRAGAYWKSGKLNRYKKNPPQAFRAATVNYFYSFHYFFKINFLLYFSCRCCQSVSETVDPMYKISHHIVITSSVTWLTTGGYYSICLILFIRNSIASTRNYYY